MRRIGFFAKIVDFHHEPRDQFREASDNREVRKEDIEAWPNVVLTTDMVREHARVSPQIYIQAEIEDACSRKRERERNKTLQDVQTNKVFFLEERMYRKGEPADVEGLGESHSKTSANIAVIVNSNLHEMRTTLQRRFDAMRRALYFHAKKNLDGAMLFTRHKEVGSSGAIDVSKDHDAPYGVCDTTFTIRPPIVLKRNDKFVMKLGEQLLDFSTQSYLACSRDRSTKSDLPWHRVGNRQNGRPGRC